MRTVVCIPTYCERENLRPLVEEIVSTVPTVDVMVVDGQSPDGTGALADELAAEHERVRVVHMDAPGTMATAIMEGFRRALAEGYEQVLQMDADFSHQPRFLTAMLEALEGADVVVGSRYVEGGRVGQWSVGRRVVSRAGNLYVGAMLGTPYRDATSGFVGYKRHVLEAVDFEELDGENRGFQIELKYRAHRLGFTIVEVPIHFWDRVVGSSKLTPKIAVDSFVNVLRVRLKGD